MGGRRGAQPERWGMPFFRAGARKRSVVDTAFFVPFGDEKTAEESCGTPQDALPERGPLLSIMRGGHAREAVAALGEERGRFRQNASEAWQGRMAGGCRFRR